VAPKLSTLKVCVPGTLGSGIPGSGGRCTGAGGAGSGASLVLPAWGLRGRRGSFFGGSKALGGGDGDGGGGRGLLGEGGSGLGPGGGSGAVELGPNGGLGGAQVPGGVPSGLSFWAERASWEAGAAAALEVLVDFHALVDGSLAEQGQVVLGAVRGAGFPFEGDTGCAGAGGRAGLGGGCGVRGGVSSLSETATAHPTGLDSR